MRMLGTLCLLASLVGLAGPVSAANKDLSLEARSKAL